MQSQNKLKIGRPRSKHTNYLSSWLLRTLKNELRVTLWRHKLTTAPASSHLWMVWFKAHWQEATFFRVSLARNKWPNKKEMNTTSLSQFSQRMRGKHSGFITNFTSATHRDLQSKWLLLLLTENSKQITYFEIVPVW